jgi:hypothetical protein
MNGNNMMATRRTAADAHADRLLGLVSARNCQRFQPYLRRVLDAGTIGVTILDLHGFGHA